MVLQERRLECQRLAIEIVLGPEGQECIVVINKLLTRAEHRV